MGDGGLKVFKDFSPGPQPLQLFLFLLVPFPAGLLLLGVDELLEVGLFESQHLGCLPVLGALDNPLGLDVLFLLLLALFLLTLKLFLLKLLYHFLETLLEVF